MGTLLDISASAQDAQVLLRALEAAMVAVERVERLMSFHDAASELSRLNRDAAQGPVVVDPWTYAVVRRALRIAAASEGLFDVTVAPALVRRGWLPAPASAAVEGATWRDIGLLPGLRIVFARPLWIDLGGIAKGFAVDVAIHALRRGGCTEALVNAGGDLRAFGSTLRPIHLRRVDGVVPVAQLRCGAVATSSPHAAAPDRLAQPLGHIVDPRQDTEWMTGGSVMVAAPTCLVADALTKVAALAGPDSASVLARFGAQVHFDRT
jgi:thiamine biosynthesis lipoprotein